jgi:trimeric autotransporter adhesin
MTWRNMAERHSSFRAVFCLILWLTIAIAASASEHHGQVSFGGLPVPGATVRATQGSQQLSAITDQQGLYSFPDLKDGTWEIQITMSCFAPLSQQIVVTPDAPRAKWELHLLPLDQIRAQIETATHADSKAPRSSEQLQVPVTALPSLEPSATEEASSQLAEDGLLINGSTNNGAASPFAQLAAFGNNRLGQNGLYNGSAGMILDNSAWDARPYSLSGQNTAKPAYNRVSGVATFGGALKIPHLLEHGPFFFLGYQWSRDRNNTTESALMPTSADRDGDFSRAVNGGGQPVEIFDPGTGQPFPGSIIPTTRISSQAQSLLKFYPLPNVSGNPLYNYQVPIISNTHQDAMQSRLDKTFNPKNEVYGDFAFQSTRTGTPNLFDFLDTTDVLGINAGGTWSHRIRQRLVLNFGYRYSRLASRVTPFWENRQNVSGVAGITGNNQDPMNWGPPTLAFASGIAQLSDQQSSHNRNQTGAGSYAMLWSHDRHNLKFGADFRRQEFNYLAQQNPRGTFTFTGQATQGTVNGVAIGGFDLADFLLGIPDTSAIAFGNADKYFRESGYDAYLADDWRVDPELTVNAGLRWEYGAPITELFSRLVNLDITPGFSAAAPVVADNPIGPLTGRHYPTSLINPYNRGFQPRVGIAWRPISGSSLVIRAGYGIYYDTSVYQAIALQMSQQAPLSKSLSVQNSAACRLTLGNGFNTCPSTTPDSFAIDPDFRPGYAQNWQLSAQRDLSGSLLLTVTYLGSKGTRGPQDFLPNTNPLGAVNPCPTCPAGFAYLTSNGDSTRQAGQVQLRRRLHNGLTGTLQYTFSKSTDDDALLGGQGAGAVTQNTPQSPYSFNTPTTSETNSGSSPASPTIAQNWLDLRGERGPSTFDQRHLLTAQLQYTTGMGLGGKTLRSGWQGLLFKEWTFVTQINAGSGLPETPIFLAAVPGTGVTGTIRPDLTGAPIYRGASGLFLNPAAYAPPSPGQWGQAGRDSVIGPREFGLNASLGRTFRLRDRLNLDFRFDAANALNRVTFTSWTCIINNAQFGLPAGANAMRSMQATLRLRF